MFEGNGFNATYQFMEGKFNGHVILFYISKKGYGGK
jgi:hypothetical protein